MNLSSYAEMSVDDDDRNVSIEVSFVAKKRKNAPKIRRFFLRRVKKVIFRCCGFCPTYPRGPSGKFSAGAHGSKPFFKFQGSSTDLWSLQWSK